MINFGQPRVGDETYANFSDAKFTNQLRVTHNQDPVPHLPLQTKPQNFYHTRTEMYEDVSGNVKTCNASGEDPTCADQWNALQQNVADHLVYLGTCVGCGTVCSPAVEIMLQ